MVKADEHCVRTTVVPLQQKTNFLKKVRRRRTNS